MENDIKMDLTRERIGGSGLESSGYEFGTSVELLQRWK
jgi:hypothetical protein